MCLSAATPILATPLSRHSPCSRNAPHRTCRQSKKSKRPAGRNVTIESDSEEAEAAAPGGDAIAVEEAEEDGEEAVEDGDVEKILQRDGARLLVKFQGKPYRAAAWVPAAAVEAARPNLVQAFDRKGVQTDIDPAWLRVDKVVAHWEDQAGNTHYLVSAIH